MGPYSFCTLLKLMMPPWIWWTSGEWDVSSLASLGPTRQGAWPARFAQFIEIGALCQRQFNVSPVSVISKLTVLLVNRRRHTASIRCKVARSAVSVREKWWFESITPYQGDKGSKQNSGQSINYLSCHLLWVDSSIRKKGSYVAMGLLRVDCAYSHTRRKKKSKNRVT